MKALILNDYSNKTYATWFKEGIKTIETRWKLFKYRGDLVICCGKTNSVGPNAGKALCIVNIYDGRVMLKEDEEKACIEWHPKRKVLLTNNLRHFSEDFIFAQYATTKNFQGIFDIEIPSHINIIPVKHKLTT